MRNIVPMGPRNGRSQVYTGNSPLTISAHSCFPWLYLIIPGSQTAWPSWGHWVQLLGEICHWSWNWPYFLGENSQGNSLFFWGRVKVLLRSGIPRAGALIRAVLIWSNAVCKFPVQSRGSMSNPFEASYNGFAMRPNLGIQILQNPTIP